MDGPGFHVEIGALEAASAGDGLVNIGTGAWTGPAAEEFRDKFSYEPNK